MNIGQAADAAGVSAKMIRYYESIGLIPEAGRTEAGYRIYTDTDINSLRFIHRAREFGFPIERIRVLVGLWQGNHPSRKVKQVALDHVTDLDRRIAALSEMRDALRALADTCRGDHRPECPILRDLESNTPPDAPPLRTPEATNRSGKHDGANRGRDASRDVQVGGRT